MYLPAHFSAPSDAAVAALIDAYPLATLVYPDARGLGAEHVPLLYLCGETGAGTLQGHVARGNPVWRLAGQGMAALAVFCGPQHYVSPGWYPSKRAHGQVVPTWNYCVVHVHGRLRAVDDRVWLRDLLTRLTGRRERDRAEPWAVSDAPADYLERMIGGVVGIELAVERIEAKWKLSQNRDQGDRAGVVAGLGALDDPSARSTAAAMSELEP